MARRTGASWSIAERRELMEQWMKGQSLPRIAAQHERTAGAIAWQLETLGLVEDREEALIEIETESENNMKIKTKFWLLQNGNITGTKDNYGHDILSWPGRSIFTSKEDAEAAAEEMLQEDPHGQFFVMEAVCLITPTKTPITKADL